MLIALKSHGIPIRKYYFTDPPHPGWADMLLPTAYMDCRAPSKPKLFVVENRHTLLTDLRPDEESIYQNFPKDTRSQIRRSEASGQFTLNLSSNPQQFLDLFNQFADMRQLSTLSMAELKYLNAEESCLLSMDKDDKTVICHLYLLSRTTGIASILISVSDQRYNGDTAMRKAIGHANRALHWQGMRYLKAQGFHTYDWCGYVPDTPDPVMQGINRFKRTFNGTLTPIYNYYSLSYGIIEYLRKQLKKYTVK